MAKLYTVDHSYNMVQYSTLLHRMLQRQCWNINHTLNKKINTLYLAHSMMTSSTGHNFHVTDPLLGESTGEAELWCFLWFTPEQTVEQQPVIWDAIPLIMTSLSCLLHNPSAYEYPENIFTVLLCIVCLGIIMFHWIYIWINYPNSWRLFQWHFYECMVDNMSTLVQVMTWRQTGAKPLPEPILSLFTVTGPHCVNDIEAEWRIYACVN